MSFHMTANREGLDVIIALTTDTSVAVARAEQLDAESEALRLLAYAAEDAAREAIGAATRSQNPGQTSANAAAASAVAEAARVFQLWAEAAELASQAALAANAIAQKLRDAACQACGEQLSASCAARGTASAAATGARQWAARSAAN